MKKLILALAFIGFAFTIISVQAQTQTAPVQPKKQESAVKAAAPKEVKKTDAVHAETKPAAEKKADVTTPVLKKDGTPDKRFKANMPAKGPLKKDGTPDKRYKANKAAAPAAK